MTGNGAPDYLEPVEGWRAWLVVEAGDDDLRLASFTFPALWPRRRRLEAHCKQESTFLLPGRVASRNHAAPSPACRCGIYALSNIRDAAHIVGYSDALTRDRTGRRIVGVALGTVALWGSVVECSRGWRAEFGYPARLYVPQPRAPWRYPPDVVAPRLADAYCVPAEPISCSEATRLSVLVTGSAIDRW